MEAITYSLKANQNDSNKYYEDVKSFTGEVLKEFEGFENSIIPDFSSFINKNGSKIRQYEEYIFEFLMLGTFWKVYSVRAANLDEKPQLLLESFAKIRNENQSAKENVDIVRGMLMTLFLLPDEKNNTESQDLTIGNFNKLLGYLKATGEFTQEVGRLEIWSEFLETKTPEIVSKYLSNAFLFADWFEYRSEKALGQYSVNVDKFLEEKHQDHLFKEDVVFCGRERVEYHLNMVGAEIMNRAFNKEFKERPRKALLLPGCMRRSQKICKAEETNLGLRCTECLKNCNVHQLTDMGDKYGFEVYIISHESSAFSKSSKEDRDELGIIGVACVSNLIAGGWKSDSIGIPAQCVLLDQASCNNHWHEEGIPTEINIHQLFKLFNVESEENYELELIPSITE